jgi:hypothetical protein
MLRAAVDTFDGPEGARGCLLVLGAPTRTRTTAPIHDRLHALRCNSPELLRRRLERAVADREIPAGVDLDNIAAFYTAVGHGLAISARDGAQKHMLLAIVAPVGIAQDAVAVALENSHASIGAYVDELEARRDVVMRQLDGLPFGVPDGGWSLLLCVSDFGLTGESMSRRLLDQGVCATGMSGWGETRASEYIRFVFANEPPRRLRTLGERVRRALDG